MGQNYSIDNFQKNHLIIKSSVAIHKFSLLMVFVLLGNYDKKYSQFSSMLNPIILPKHPDELAIESLL